MKKKSEGEPVLEVPCKGHHQTHHQETPRYGFIDVIVIIPSPDHKSHTQKPCLFLGWNLPHITGTIQWGCSITDDASNGGTISTIADPQIHILSWLSKSALCRLQIQYVLCIHCFFFCWIYKSTLWVKSRILPGSYMYVTLKLHVTMCLRKVLINMLYTCIPQWS